MRNYLRILILTILTIGYNQSKATHMIGADIQYRFIDKDTLEVTVSAYKDCKGINMAALALSISGISCNYSNSYTMTQINCKDATPVCKSSCTKCDASSCNAYGYPNGGNAACSFAYGIEKLVFQQVIVLTNTNCCNFRLEVSQSNRTGALTTCCAGEYLYVFADIDRCLSPLNSSPVMLNDPISIVCANNCINMNMGAVDTVDGDYVTSHLVPVLNAYGTSCSYTGNYTYQYPLYYDGFPNSKKYLPSSCKGLLLDSATGDFFFKPMQQEVAQYAIELREWRKDTAGKLQLIGLTRRDMALFIMANCSNKAPTLPAKNATICAGDKICIDSIQSSDANSKDTVLLTWDNGIPKGTFTSNFKSNNLKQYFNFCWQTSSTDGREIPYIFTVTAQDGACPLLGMTSRSYSIFVGEKIDSNRIKYKITQIACGGIKLESSYDTTANIKYSWTVDNVQYKIKDTIIYNNSAGWHYVKLVVSGVCNSIVFLDSINVPSHFQASIGNDTAICSSSQLSFKATSINGTAPYKYQWYTNSMQQDTLDNYTYFANASNIMKCKVTDSSGCASTVSVKITFDSLPHSFLGIGQTKCAGDSVILNALNNMSSYIWKDYITGSTLSSNQSIKIDSSVTLQCYITDSNGCQSTDTVTFNFIPKVVVDLGSDQTVCRGSTIKLVARGAGVHEWYIKNQNIYNGDTYYYTPTTAQTLVVKGFNTVNSITCEGVDSIYVDLFTPPTISLQDSFIVCKGDTATLKATGSNTYKYKWNNGDTTNTLYTKFTGNYTITATDTNGCTVSKQTALYNFPQNLSVKLSVSNDTLYANSTPAATNFTWYLDNQYYNTSSYPWQYLTKTGIYTVKILDAYGCFVSSQAYTVTALHSYISSPQNMDEIKVYPNPSTGIYYIESPGAINDLTIYDLMGRKVYNSSSKNNIIDLSSQPEGIYLLQINKNVWMRLSKL